MLTVPLLLSDAAAAPKEVGTGREVVVSPPKGVVVTDPKAPTNGVAAGGLVAAKIDIFANLLWDAVLR